MGEWLGTYGDRHRLLYASSCARVLSLMSAFRVSQYRAFVAALGIRSIAIRKPQKRCGQFTAIDDCTRFRMLKLHDRYNQTTAIQFIDEVRRRLPFRIHVVQTDNGAEFQ